MGEEKRKVFIVYILMIPPAGVGSIVGTRESNVLVTYSLSIKKTFLSVLRQKKNELRH